MEYWNAKYCDSTLVAGGLWGKRGWTVPPPCMRGISAGATVLYPEPALRPFNFRQCPRPYGGGASFYTYGPRMRTMNAGPCVPILPQFGPDMPNTRP